MIEDMKGRVSTLQEHIARYNFALQYVNDRNTLDASCGTGYGVDIMSNVASEVSGCDISEEAIEECKKNYPNCTFFTEDLNSPKDTNFYGAIVSFETIEHLDKPEEFLKWASEHCDMFVFSIPIRRPSEFHKQVWDTWEIRDLINKYFTGTEFYYQTLMNFYNVDINAHYVVGIGRGKKNG